MLVVFSIMNDHSHMITELLCRYHEWLSHWEYPSSVFCVLTNAHLHFDHLISDQGEVDRHYLTATANIILAIDKLANVSCLVITVLSLWCFSFNINCNFYSNSFSMRDSVLCISAYIYCFIMCRKRIHFLL